MIIWDTDGTGTITADTMEVYTRLFEGLEVFEATNFILDIQGDYVLADYAIDGHAECHGERRA